MFFREEENSVKSDAPATLRDLAFYFDSIECDVMDHGALGRKNAQVLTLKQKLLALPEPQFDAAIKTIAKLVDDSASARAAADAARLSPTKREAIELFERTSESTAARNTAPERVSRV